MKYILLTLLTMAAPAFAVPGPVKKKSGKEVVFTELFNEADANGDGVLNEAEFGKSYGASERPVVTEYRFDVLSTSAVETRAINLEVIYLEAFIEANGGRKIYPSKSEMFDLADDNNDNLLTPLEFYYTRISSASNSRSSFKAFIKLDKNDDGYLSPAEFGVEIKG